MNYSIVIVDEAKVDFKKSLKWYKDINRELAKKFNLSFKKSLELLKENPLHFQLRYSDVRTIFD